VVATARICVGADDASEVVRDAKRLASHRAKRSKQQQPVPRYTLTRTAQKDVDRIWLFIAKRHIFHGRRNQKRSRREKV
jgi:hypothetical protein